MTAGLVSVIGPPAVGKTTLAEALAAALGAEMIYEDYAGNPFLAEAYLGNADAHLPAQLYYVMSRVRQLALATWPAGGTRVSDYGFCQDRLYARANLRADELALYERLARRLAPLVKPPDVAVHLDADEQTLLGRIAARGRQFERAFGADFLARMRAAYEAAVPAIGCEAIRVNCDEVDVRDLAAVADIARRVRERL